MFTINILSFLKTIAFELIVFLSNGKYGINILHSPFNKNSTFTIIDDTDYARYEYIKPIYDELNNMGIKITKTVWVLESEGKWGNTTDTTANAKYTSYIKKLQDEGFEIALHCVSGESNKRRSIIKGYEIFKDIFGSYPQIYVMHSQNRENFEMGDESSEYFWGDIYQEKNTKYLRKNKYIKNINTLNVYKLGTNTLHKLVNMLDPKYKYKAYKVLKMFRRKIIFYDSKNHYVNHWFYSSYGNHKSHFLQLLSNQNIDQLVAEKGLSIVFTHLACGFCDVYIDNRWIESEFEKFNNHGWTTGGWDVSLKYRFNPQIKQQLQKIVDAGVWCVPVSEVLNRYLLLQNVKVKRKINSIIIKNNNQYPIEGLAIQIKTFNNIKKIRINNIYLCYISEEGQFFIPELMANQEIKVNYEYGSWDENVPRVKVPKTTTLKKAYYDGLKTTIAVDKKCVVELSKPLVHFFCYDTSNNETIRQGNKNSIRFTAEADHIYHIFEKKIKLRAATPP